MRYDLSPHELFRDDEERFAFDIAAPPAEIQRRGIPDMSPIVWDALSPGADYYLTAARHGLLLSDAFKAVLFDEPVPSKQGISVLGRASMMVGSVVNRRQKLSELFAESQDRPENWRPAEEQFDSLIESVHDEPYKLLTRMLRDAAYPRKSEPGYKQIAARAPEQAYTVISSPSGVPKKTKLCDYSDELFASLLANRRKAERTGELRPVERGNHAFGLLKTKTDQLMLSTDSLLLNGVRIEPGALMTVEGSRRSGYSFAFGRWSVFSCATFYQSVRYFARNLADSALVFAEDEQSLERGLVQFREFAGLPLVDEPNVEALMPKDESSCSREEQLQLNVQDQLYDMATILESLRGTSPDQAVTRERIIRCMHGLRRSMIEAFGPTATDRVQIAHLGRIAARQRALLYASEAG